MNYEQFKVLAGILALAAWTMTAWGQSTKVDLRTQGKSVDFTAANSTKPIQAGSALPATCSVGELFFHTTALSGQNLFVCPQSNVWAPAGATGNWTAGNGVRISGQQIATEDALIPIYYTGNGAPGLECQAGRDYYVDVLEKRLYYCSAANEWAAVVPDQHTHTAEAIVNGTLDSARLAENVVLNDRSTVYLPGAQQSFQHDGISAGLRVVPATGDPAAPSNGDIWYNEGTNSLRCHEGGVTKNCTNPTGGSGGIVSVNADSTPAQTITAGDDLQVSTNSGETVVRRKASLNGDFKLLPADAVSGAAVTAISVATANRVYAWRFYLAYPLQVNHLAFQITTSAAATCAVGIYNREGASKLIETGPVDVSTSGVKYVTIGQPVTLSPGFYNLAWGCSSTTVQYRGFASSVESSVSNAGGNVMIGYSETELSGGQLPTSLGTLNAGASLPVLVTKLIQ